MSIKRTKQRSYGAGKGENDDPWAKPPEPEPVWEEVTADKGDDAFTPYSMTTRFAKGQLIAHSKFGKGVVVATEGTSVTVLFQDGKKKLGHAATA